MPRSKPPYTHHVCHHTTFFDPAHTLFHTTQTHNNINTLHCIPVSTRDNNVQFFFAQFAYLSMMIYPSFLSMYDASCRQRVKERVKERKIGSLSILYLSYIPSRQSRQDRIQKAKKNNYSFIENGFGCSFVCFFSLSYTYISLLLYISRHICSSYSNLYSLEKSTESLCHTHR